MAAIDGPVTPLALVSEWRPDVVTAAALLLFGAGWGGLRLAARAQRVRQPWGRDVALVGGVAVGLWVTCGFLQARAGQLMWVWTTQQLLLLLVVPMVVVAGQPVALARAVRGPDAGVVRLVGSRAMRLAGHPLLGPLYVPVLCGLLFFGGLGAWSLRSTGAGWVLHPALLCVGALIAPPLAARDQRSSLAIGAALAVGLVELLADAVPGLVLRLETHLTLSHFGTGRPPWSPSWLGDQQVSGAILWTVAELLDLPFLVLVVALWIRADAREARPVDAALDRRAVAAGSPASSAAATAGLSAAPTGPAGPRG